MARTAGRQARGAPCLALDFPQGSQRLLPDAGKLVSPRNLSLLLSGPPPARALLERRRGLLPLAHVGGWQHLLPGQEPPALAQRLALPAQACLLV